MNTIEKLHAIEKVKRMYSIVYRSNGIGFMFFEPERITGHLADVEWDNQAPMVREKWKQGLVVREYYKTFEEAVEGEYERLEQALEVM